MMEKNKDIIIKSLCETIAQQNRLIDSFIRENNELREVIEDMKEREKNGQATGTF